MTFRFQDREVRTGHPEHVHFPVAVTAAGAEIRIPLHIVPGQRSGPAVLLCAGSHGEEVWSTEFLRRVHGDLHERDFDFAGTILLAPVLSPTSFEAGPRHTPFDYHNLNRIFPGQPAGAGWFTEMIADVITREILPAADIVLDYHGGGTDTSIRYQYTVPPGDTHYHPVHDVALASGAEVLWEVSETRSTLTTEVTKAGKVAIIPEIGGGGDLCDEAMFDRGLASLANMLRVLDVFPGEVDAAAPRIVVRKGRAVRPRHGGLFIPEVGLDTLGTSVPEGTVLGKVVSPYTFEMLDELTAPYPKTEIMQVRNRISRVHPGDYAFIVGDGESGYTP
jgi:hypothetical protein